MKTRTFDSQEAWKNWRLGKVPEPDIKMFVDDCPRLLSGSVGSRLYDCIGRAAVGLLDRRRMTGSGMSRRSSVGR